METQNITHLLSSMGVLASFSIGKKVPKVEIDKTTKRIQKVFKEKDPAKFQKLLADALIEQTKKTVNQEIPPGILFPVKNKKKDELDKFYMELSFISHTLANKFIQQKLNKHQVCFIINACINILGIGEDDFAEFHRKFQKYKNDDFSDEDE